MSSNIQQLIVSLPHLSKNDLFNIAVYNNNQEDVKYLMTNYKAEINVMGLDNGNFLLDCIGRTKNINMFTYILMYGAGKLESNNPRFTYPALAKAFPNIIPYLTARLKFEKRVTKEIISIFVDIALDHNSPKAMKPLLEFKEHINEYRYTLLVCGAGTVLDVKGVIETVKEMPDECVETAYFGENFPVLEYLRGIVPSTNPFLAQKITQDGNVNYYRVVNGIEGN